MSSYNRAGDRGYACRVDCSELTKEEFLSALGVHDGTVGIDGEHPSKPDPYYADEICNIPIQSFTIFQGFGTS